MHIPLHVALWVFNSWSHFFGWCCYINLYLNNFSPLVWCELIFLHFQRTVWYIQALMFSRWTIRVYRQTLPRYDIFAKNLYFRSYGCERLWEIFAVWYWNCLFLFECKANPHKWLQISGFVSSFSSVIFDQGVRG